MVLENFIIDTTITWDRVSKSIFEHPQAKPGRKLRVQVTNAGVIEDLTGSTLNLGWKNQANNIEGLDVFTAVDITKGLFEIAYTSGMLSNVGSLKASLLLIDVSEVTIAESNDFVVRVAASSVSQNAGQSVGSWTTLAEILLNEDARVQNEAGRVQAELTRVETFDALVDSEMIAQNVATKLTEKELTYAPRLLSAEQQLADIVLVADNAESVANTASQKADAMASGSPKGVYATLALLQAAYPTGTTGAYLVTADGNWYYWSGGAWAIGGVYQSTGIAVDSVDANRLERVYLEPELETLTSGASFLKLTNIVNPVTIKPTVQTAGERVLATKDNLCSIPDILPTVQDGITYSVEGGVFTASGTVGAGAGWSTTIGVWPKLKGLLGQKVFMQFYIKGAIPAGGYVELPINIGYNVSATASSSDFGTVQSVMNNNGALVIPRGTTINVTIAILLRVSDVNLGSLAFTNGNRKIITSKGLENVSAYDSLFTESGTTLAVKEQVIVEAAQPKSVFDGKKLLFTGDSITYGANWRPTVEDWSTTGWRKIIQENHPLAVTRGYGSGGWRIARIAGDTKSILNKIDLMMTDHPDADYIILQGGVNDCWDTEITQGVITSGFNDTYDEYTFCGAMESMIRKCLLNWKGKKIGFITTHKIPSAQPKMETYMTLAKQICEKWGVPCLDLYHEIGTNVALESVNTLYMQNGDYTHPNEVFYRAYYAPKIEAWMKVL